MTAEAVADGIVERERSDAALRYGVLDPACFKEDGGPSIAERMNKELLAARLRPFHAADNARVPQRGSMGGWDQLRSRLVGQDGRPMIYCFTTHADSIRTIPALQHDPARPEDVNTESEDHAADEWRYACMSRPFVWVPVARTSVPDVGYAAFRGRLRRQRAAVSRGHPIHDGRGRLGARLIIRWNNSRMPHLRPAHHCASAPAPGAPAQCTDPGAVGTRRRRPPAPCRDRSRGRAPRSASHPAYLRGAPPVVFRGPRPFLKSTWLACHPVLPIETSMWWCPCRPLFMRRTRPRLRSRRGTVTPGVTRAVLRG
jgi:hypothetical protein